tara:strand:- start:1883 stop:2209 length:327 start_codon:yes stop_codon:yes gene_type:complete
MATQKNIVIDQGTTFSENVTAKDSAGSAKDLTGYTSTAQIRKSYYSSSSTDFTIAQVDATGVITISLTAAQTGNLKAGRYVYDVESASASETIRVVEGIVTVTPQVTK